MAPALSSIDSVVDALKCLAYMHECKYSENRCSYYMEQQNMCDNVQIAKEALALLEGNAPLSLEELRSMEGQPVWVEVLDHDVFADKADDFDGWGLCRASWVRVWDAARADLVHIDYDFETYGKEWRAYRRQRKEERPLEMV